VRMGGGSVVKVGDESADGLGGSLLARPDQI
jgi:hypothetical protein